MATVSIRELRNGLSAAVRRIQAGERLLVLRHGRAVAVLAPVEEGEGTDDVSLVARLAARGLCDPPSLKATPPSPGYARLTDPGPAVRGHRANGGLTMSVTLWVGGARIPQAIVARALGRSMSKCLTPCWRHDDCCRYFARRPSGH